MYMTIEEIYKTRWQVRQYDEANIPDKDLIKSLVSKTFELSPSKQNLLPFRVHVLGPEQLEYKKQFWNISKGKKGGANNYNIFAPYFFMFTFREVTNPNLKVKMAIKYGHDYTCCTPQYKKAKIPNSLEIGMFASILTGLSLEKKLAVSYLLCFPDLERDSKDYEGILPFLKGDYPVFCMGLGYTFGVKELDNRFRSPKDLEYKPEIEEVINWI